MFSLSGLSFAPADAIEYVRNSADIILNKNGGDGAVREMIEYILKRDGLEHKFIEPWL
jgi:3-deoxy-D-manno-octulosonate 8-phosphate phosphatase (KDO 8-P phosphatase)